MKEKKVDFAFVILHYKTIEDTISCVKSIEKYMTSNYYIVIVDNYSNNNTGEELEKKYKNNNNIKVIINRENYGFSKGNNVGFKYVKENIKTDYIVLCNSDTELINNSFAKKIKQDYEKYNFAVLGPKIKLLNNKYNPLRIKMPTIRNLKTRLFYKRIELLMLKIKVLIPIYDCLKKIKDNNSSDSKADINKEHKDILLHGCFWIFSKKYIEKFDGLNAVTFLYREEELLYLQLKEANMHNYYDPNIVILHKEDGSTNAITKSPIKKRIFIAKNQVKAIKALIIEMKKTKGGY